MNRALFNINGDGADQGYLADPAEALVFTLRLPAGASSWQLQVFDPGASEFNPLLSILQNSPQKSKGAPSFQLTGTTTGATVAASSPVASITGTAPAAGNSYVIRSVVNGGMSGSPARFDPTLVHERILAIPTAGGLRKPIITEATQYEPDGIAGVISDIIDGDVGGPGGSVEEIELVRVVPSFGVDGASDYDGLADPPTYTGYDHEPHTLPEFGTGPFVVGDLVLMPTPTPEGHQLLRVVFPGEDSPGEAWQLAVHTSTARLWMVAEGSLAGSLWARRAEAPAQIAQLQYVTPPGGASGNVQFNNGTGGLGGVPEFAYDSTTHELTIQRLVGTNQILYNAELDNGDSSIAETIDWTLRSLQKSRLTGDCLYAFNYPATPTALTFKLIQDPTGGWVPTFPASVRNRAAISAALITTADTTSIVSLYWDMTDCWAGILCTGVA